MKASTKKLILGASLVGAMTLASACSTMGMCGGSKCGSNSEGKCGSEKKADAGKCGAEKKESASKCGSK